MCTRRRTCLYGVYVLIDKSHDMICLQSDWYVQGIPQQDLEIIL